MPKLKSHANRIQHVMEIPDSSRRESLTIQMNTLRPGIVPRRKLIVGEQCLKYLGRDSKRIIEAGHIVGIEFLDKTYTPSLWFHVSQFLGQ